MSELESSQGDRCCPMGFEAQHGAASALDCPVILFDDVVEVPARTHEDAFPAMILSAKPAQAQVAGLVAIQGDLARPSRRAGLDRLTEERHCRSYSALRMEQRPDRLAFLVDSTIGVSCFRSGPNVGLINAPGRADRPRATVPPLLVLRHVSIDPAHDRSVADVHAPFGHEGDEIAIAQAVGQVPANTALDPRLTRAQSWHTKSELDTFSAHPIALPPTTARLLDRRPRSRLTTQTALVAERISGRLPDWRPAI